jgi:hypothetical protein
VETSKSDVVEVVPEDYSYVFNPYREPVASVQTGQRVLIHTEDAFESRINTADDLPSQALATAKFLNPQTGPIFVEGQNRETPWLSGWRVSSRSGNTPLVATSHTSAV